MIEVSHLAIILGLNRKRLFLPIVTIMTIFKPSAVCQRGSGLPCQCGRIVGGFLLWVAGFAFCCRKDWQSHKRKETL